MTSWILSLPVDAYKHIVIYCDYRADYLSIYQTILHKLSKHELSKLIQFWFYNSKIEYFPKPHPGIPGMHIMDKYAIKKAPDGTRDSRFSGWTRIEENGEIIKVRYMNGRICSLYERSAVIGPERKEVWRDGRRYHNMHRPSLVYKGNKEWYHYYYTEIPIRKEYTDGYIEHRQTYYDVYGILHQGPLHSYDGPAIVHPDGTTEWWYKGIRGLPYKEDIPSVKYSDSSVVYTKHDCIHSYKDKPAVKFASGHCEWRTHGVLDRQRGPAIIFPDGTKHYYVDGKLQAKDFIKAIDELKERQIERRSRRNKLEQLKKRKPEIITEPKPKSRKSTKS